MVQELTDDEIAFVKQILPVLNTALSRGQLTTHIRVKKSDVVGSFLNGDADEVITGNWFFVHSITTQDSLEANNVIQWSSLATEPRANAKSGALNHANVIADRVYFFPDKNGTVAMLDDVSGGVGALAVEFHAHTHNADLVHDAPNIPESSVTGLVTDLAAKAPLASPALTGTPTAPTASVGTNTTQIATTAFVLANGTSLPIAQSDVTGLVSDLAAKAPLASPTFTGTPVAPTPSAGDNSTKIATTAFVHDYALLASPTFTGTPAAPTPTLGDDSTTIATTAFVTSTIIDSFDPTFTLTVDQLNALGQTYGIYQFTPTPADGATFFETYFFCNDVPGGNFTLGISVKPGTWSLLFKVQTGPTCGKFYGEINHSGTTQFTIDTYDATGVYQIYFQIYGQTLNDSSGFQTIRIVADDSTGGTAFIYLFSISGYWQGP